MASGIILQSQLWQKENAKAAGKEKQKKRKGKAPPSTGPTGQLATVPPYGPRPTSTSRPSSPHRSPLPPVPPVRTATGARRRPTTSPATPRVDKGPSPRRLDLLHTYLHPRLEPPRPLRLSLSHSFVLERRPTRSPPCLARPRGHRAPFASPSCPSSLPSPSTPSPSVSVSREPLRGADRAAPFRLCRRRTPSSSATAAATNLTPIAAPPQTSSPAPFPAKSARATTTNRCGVEWLFERTQPRVEWRHKTLFRRGSSGSAVF